MVLSSIYGIGLSTVHVAEYKLTLSSWWFKLVVTLFASDFETNIGVWQRKTPPYLVALASDYILYIYHPKPFVKPYIKTLHDYL